MTILGSPVVSVILPTRNRADVLPRSLESALAQRGPDLEVIVVDDASTDATPGLLQDRRERDQRLRVIRNPEPSGAATARNRAAAEANGQFLAFLDDDDEWLPGKLKRQVELARRKGADVVHCRFTEIAPDGAEQSAGRQDLAVAPARTALVRGNVLALSAVLVCRSTFERVGGFDERLPRLQDWDLWIRLSEECSFALLAEPCVRIHLVGERISTDRRALAQAADIFAEKYRREFPLPRQEHADLLLSLARLLALAGEMGAGRRLASRALRRHPWSPVRSVEALVVMLGPRTYRGARRLARSLLPRWRPAGGRVR